MNAAEEPTPHAPETAGEDAMGRLLARPLDEEDLREQTAHVAHPVEEASAAGQSMLFFELGGDPFAIASIAVARVSRLVGPHRIPHRSNDVLRGFANIDGELVLCANLAGLLGLTPPAENETLERRMIVLDPPEDRWAFAVDRTLGVTNVDADALRSPPLTVEHARGTHTSALVEIGDVRAAVLDADRLRAGFKAALT